jgi:hypothetical protein
MIKPNYIAAIYSLLLLTLRKMNVKLPPQESLSEISNRKLSHCCDIAKPSWNQADDY